MLQRRNEISILIVDNNKTDRELVLEIIKKKFPNLIYEIAINGKEAYKKIDNKMFDIILLDIRLGEISGFDVFNRIKQKWTRVICYTRYDLEFLFESGKKGFHDFVSKSQSPDELVKIIKKQIEIIEKHPENSILKNIFCVMPFNDELNDLYELGIKEAAREVGIECERSDKIKFTGSILKKIQDQIKNSGIIIAVLTDHNPNVYYEVGYADGLKKKHVIFLCDSPDSIYFDLTGMNCIIYNNNILKVRDELIDLLAHIRREKLNFMEN